MSKFMARPQSIMSKRRRRRRKGRRRELRHCSLSSKKVNELRFMLIAGKRGDVEAHLSWWPAYASPLPFPPIFQKPIVSGANWENFSPLPSIRFSCLSSFSSPTPPFSIRLPANKCLSFSPGPLCATITWRGGEGERRNLIKPLFPCLPRSTG